jgi:O-antigen/teichoic acid export membrane protein
MKYFKNISWIFGERILRMFVGLFVGVWVTRYLGPEQFGILSYAQSFVGLFVVIATFGLDSIVVRDLVKNEYNANLLLGTAFWLKLSGAILVLVMLAVAVQFTSNTNLENLLIFIIAASTVFQSVNVIDFYFQSKVLSKYVVFINAFSLFFSTMIKILFILFEAPVIAFAFLILFDTFILALGYLYIYYYRKLSIKSWIFSVEQAKRLLKVSSPLIIAGVINSIYMRADQVMIKEILDVTQVGYYAAAARLSEVWFGIGVLICNSLFPAIINAKKVSEEFYYNRIYKLFKFLNVISFLLAICVYFLSDWIILTLYGEVYMDASPVLSIHIFSAIFVYFGVSSGRWLINEGKTYLSLYRNILGMIANIFLNVFLIKSMGIIGAAIASLIAYSMAFYVFDIFRKDTRKIFLLKTKSIFFL